MVIYVTTGYRGRCLLCGDWDEHRVCNPCLVNWKGNVPHILAFTGESSFWTLDRLARQWR